MTTENASLVLAIGIDFGTSSCRSSHFDKNHIVMHLDELQNHSTPAYLTFKDDDSIMIGDFVKNYYDQSVNQTFNGVKRLLSDTARDAEIDLFDYALRTKYDLLSKTNVINSSPMDMCKAFLQQRVKIAKLVLHAEMSKPINAVISIADCFSSSECKTLRQTAEQAGITNVDFIEDTKAAALAYGFDNDIDPPKPLLVFSLGGGYLSIRYFAKVGNGVIEWEDRHSVSEGLGCGGEQFTEVLVKQLRERFSGNILAKPMSRHNVRLQAERLKHQLQRKIPMKVNGTTFGASDEVEVTYEEFLKRSSGILKRIHVCLDEMEKKLHPKIQIKEILLVGGSSRLCAVRDLIKKVFPEARFTEAINADEAVVYGAGLYANYTFNNQRNFTSENNLNKIILGQYYQFSSAS